MYVIIIALVNLSSSKAMPSVESTSAERNGQEKPVPKNPSFKVRVEFVERRNEKRERERERERGSERKRRRERSKSSVLSEMRHSSWILVFQMHISCSFQSLFSLAPPSVDKTAEASAENGVEVSFKSVPHIQSSVADPIH